jgi:hypothetical protein
MTVKRIQYHQYGGPEVMRLEDFEPWQSCIDLTCVMAARERQRDKQQGIVTRRLS